MIKEFKRVYFDSKTHKFEYFIHKLLSIQTIQHLFNRQRSKLFLWASSSTVSKAM